MTQRVAVVTGGIGGLGSEICKKLADQGLRVVAADLDARVERLDEFRKDTAAFNGQIVFKAINVADANDCDRLIKEVEAEYGRVDVLVNAAGITRDTTLRKMDVQQWMDVINVNLNGVFNMCRPAVEGMMARGFGRIINISSINGQMGQFGQTNYSAAKAGMHGFTMALARETAKKGVTVNSVSPGYCDTPMVRAIPEQMRNQIIESIPVGRIGQPTDIARTVAFLAAEDAGFITGANIPVNGGLFMH